MSAGVRAALEQVIADREGEAGEDLQLALGLELEATETGALDAPSPLALALVSPRKATKGGRPPGARNRRTEAVVSWLLSQHRHPLAVMMEAYSMTPQELAGRLGLPDPDLLEVYKLQLRMAEAVAPYVSQRQPQAVAIAAKGALAVSFSGVSLPAPGGSAGENPATVEGLAITLPSPKSDDGSGTAE